MNDQLSLLPKLGEIATSLTSAHDIKSLINALHKGVDNIIQCDYKAYYLLNTKKNRLNLVHSKWESEELTRMGQSIAERSLAYWVAENNKVINLSHRDEHIEAPEQTCPADHHFQLNKNEKVRAKAYIPVSTSDNKVIGVLAIASISYDQFTQETISLLKFMCALVGEVYTNILLTMEQKRIKRNLQYALSEANAAKEAKANFLAKMSHEIRTPMNGIIGMSGLLERTILDSKQKKYLDAISTSSNHLLALINDILDISKIEAEEFTLENRAFNLKDLVEKNCFSLNFQAIKKGIQLKLDLDPKLPQMVMGDSLRIGQVLINLVNNAIKFTEEGSVTVSASTLRTNPLKKEALIRFSVKDTGLGIDKNNLSKIFDRFKQEDDSVSRKFGGSGLGLAIAKEIITHHGGKIWVESTKGEGSDFIFEINFAIAENAVRVSNEAEKKIYNLKRARVLLVEDNKINSHLATMILKDNKAIVDHAFSGMEAISKVKEAQYDIILMDINMPMMNGFEATDVLRNKMNLDVPIIALTANSEGEMRDKCINAGMNDYLPKPFRYNELVQKVAEYSTLKKKAV